MTQSGKSDAFTEPAAPFKDTNEIESWAAGAVYEIRKLGIIQGTPDGNFKPKDNCTREEAAKVIVTLLETTKKVNFQ